MLFICIFMKLVIIVFTIRAHFALLTHCGTYMIYDKGSANEVHSLLCLCILLLHMLPVGECGSILHVNDMLCWHVELFRESMLCTESSSCTRMC